MTHAERGRKGGKARIAKLNAAERSALARKAGLANADRLARLKALEDGFIARLRNGTEVEQANSAKQGGDA